MSTEHERRQVAVLQLIAGYRNRGHQNALLCGLMSISGDALISLDADLQDDITVMASYGATPIADESLGTAMLYSSGTTGRASRRLKSTAANHTVTTEAMARPTGPHSASPAAAARSISAAGSSAESG